MSKKTKKAKPASTTPSYAPKPSFVVNIFDDLVPRYATAEENPNKMEPEKFELLKQAIAEHGFLQPILVTKLDDGKWRIEDGHHRWLAAKEVPGLTEITALEISIEDLKATLIGIGMNRNRGELDLGLSADIIRSVQEVLDLPLPEISVLTGFTSDELDALLASAVDEEEILEDSATEIEDPEEGSSDKLFVLEISLRDKDQLKLARRRLRKAGKGDLGVGLMTLLGVAADEESS